LTKSPRFEGKPTRAALAAVLALAVSPDGFTVADLATKVHTLTGQSKDDYTVRQAAYDLRKLRGKRLVVKPGRTRRYHVPGQAARTIAALLTLRDQVIAPILAGVHRPGPGRPPSTRTRIDRDYENLRTGMRTPLPRPRDQRGSIDNNFSIPGASA